MDRLSKLERELDAQAERELERINRVTRETGSRPETVESPRESRKRPANDRDDDPSDRADHWRRYDEEQRAINRDYHMKLGNFTPSVRGDEHGVELGR